MPGIVTLVATLGCQVICAGRLGRLDAGYAALVGLLLLAAARPLPIPGWGDGGGLAAVFLFALLLYAGLAAALLAQAAVVAVLVALGGRARRCATVELARDALCCAAAALALRVVSAPAPLGGDDLPAVALAGLTFVLGQHLLVTGVAAGRDRLGWRTMLRADLRAPAVAAALLALAPLVVVAVERGVPLVLLVLPPLLVAHRYADLSRRHEHRALHDPLTELPNRALLWARAREALAHGGQRGRVALIVVDLDRFKAVNDTLGHQVGDLLLRAVGGRLARDLRPDDTVARLGGDEFAVLLTGLPAGAVASVTAVEVARRIHAALAEPYELHGLSVDGRASLGVAVSPEHGADVDALLRHADAAMYVAKERGLGVRLYRPGDAYRPGDGGVVPRPHPPALSPVGGRWRGSPSR
ncbi:MAG TPA: GGDEF domain-containing protein [Frankiaceae bacterium]|nr:GGDEF domain-containing protein [Frankiaceae bacterium]